MNSVLKRYKKKDVLITKVLFGLILVIIFTQIINAIISPFFNDPNKIITIGSYSNFTQYNPIYFNKDQASRDLSELEYKKLIKYNPETKGFEADLCTFIIENESKTIKLRLQPNQFWHNDEAISNKDIIYTLQELYLSPEYKNPLIKQNFQKTEIYENKNQEIVFEIPQANSFFIANLEIPIFAQTDLENQDINQLNFEDLNGNNNYKIESETQEDSQSIFKLKKQKKEVQNRQINYHAIFNKDHAIKQQSNFDDLVGLQEGEIAINPNKFIKSVSLPRYQAVFFNTNNQFLRNINIRSALNMAANKKDLVPKLKDQTIIANPFFQFDNIKNIPDIKINIIQNLLIEAGLKLQNNQFYYNNQAIQLTLTYPNYQVNPSKNKTNQIIIEHLIENFKKIGIKLIPQQYDLDIFQNLLLKKEYDLILYGQDLGNNFDAFSFWHSSQAKPNKLNLSNLKDPLIDNLLINLRKSEQNLQGDLIQSLNKKLKQIVPAIFLHTENNRILIDKRVKNRKIISDYTNLAQRLSNIHKWKLN